MKNTILILIAFMSLQTSAQTENFNSLLKAGKAIFKEEFDKQDYALAVQLLEKAVKLEPQSAEAHYFLGYAYSRLNSKDGRGIINMRPGLTQKSSSEFELVSKLSPKYTGEMLVLDPYSKRTAEWGSLAIKYLYHQQKDSALWAFREGKKRGAFSDYFLAINRKTLDLCEKNAILMSSGDIFTMSLWYLQNIENYRLDLTVIDGGLINTTWYPALLEREKQVSFGFPAVVRDSIEYCQWADSLIFFNTVDNVEFSWIVKPSYAESYLLRGDRLLLNLLITNQFKRKVYFTSGYDPTGELSLEENLVSYILVDKINCDMSATPNYPDYKSALVPILELTKLVNKNSPDELRFLEGFRAGVLQRLNSEYNEGNKKQAVELLAMLEKFINPQVFPFQSEDLKVFYDNMKGALK
jgi:tetratricopeptide (TPR) repeat protein